jgi:hypothetical protein
MIVLSYLDGIAIGVGQGLYEEDLARDHLHQIVKAQIDNLLSPEAASRFGLDKNDYAFLTAMDLKWRQSKPFFSERSSAQGQNTQQ